MPYKGDWAVVLPDNTRNNMYIGQQLMEISRQKEVARLKQEQEDAARQEAYTKLVGDAFDPSKHKNGSIYDPTVVQRIADTQKKWLGYLAEQRAAGKKPDEITLRQGIVDDIASIHGDDTRAKEIQKQIDEAVEAWKGPGIDHEKLKGLALNEYFVSANPENGERAMDPKKWNKEISGADVVKAAAEKYYSVVGNNKGVDEDLRTEMKKDSPQTIKIDPIIDEKDNVVIPGYNAKVPSFMELRFDKEGNPTGLDIRQEPVLKPDGTPIKNADGSPKLTIAKDLEEKALAKPGFAIQVKKELAQQIGEENMRRKKFSETTGLPFMPVTDEEAEILKSDIVLDKFRKNAQGGMVDQRGFDDYLKMRKLKNQDRGLDISEGRLSVAREALNLKRQAAENGQNPDDVDYFQMTVDKYATPISVEVKAPKKESGMLWWKKPGEAGQYEETKILPSSTMDERDVTDMVGRDSDGKPLARPLEFKTEDGKTVKGYKLLYNESGQVVALEGRDAAGNSKTVQKEVTNEKFKKAYPKWQWKEYKNIGQRKKQEQKPATSAQPAAKPKSIKGTKKSLFE